MSTIFDIAVIGMGVAGVFAVHKLAKEHKNAKVLGIEMGRPPLKRRRQIDGWLGCLPNSDGKLYLPDIQKVSQIAGTRKSKAAFNWFFKVLSQVGDFKTTKDREPTAALEKRFKKIGYELSLNDYIQLYPREIHLMSKYLAESIERNKNVSFSFDNEVKKIFKHKGVFTIVTENQEYRCKKLIIAVGRSGWRWAKELFTSFGIVESDDTARYGIRIEMNAALLKDFNKSNCTLTREDVELGPFSWFGEVIPEDHLDMAISAFRSNEDRWGSDKVSFNLIGKRFYAGKGFEQTDRIGKLTFVLANDRIIKERVSSLLNDRSKVSILTEEYGWLKEVLQELSTVVPEITTKAYFYVPTIIPMAPEINIGNNLESEIEGMFVVGESAGLSGILSAAVSGILSADSVCK